MKNILVGSRPTSREDLSAWYGLVLEEQAKSRQSMSAFVARTGISAFSFYHWRRRLPFAMSRPDDQSARLIEVAVVRQERGSA